MVGHGVQVSKWAMGFNKNNSGLDIEGAISGSGLGGWSTHNAQLTYSALPLTRAHGCGLHLIAIRRSAGPAPGPGNGHGIRSNLRQGSTLPVHQGKGAGACGWGTGHQVQRHRRKSWSRCFSGCGCGHQVQQWASGMGGSHLKIAEERANHTAYATRAETKFQALRLLWAPGPEHPMRVVRGKLNHFGRRTGTVGRLKITALKSLPTCAPGTWARCRAKS
jgi:hypothetical protein